MSDESKTKKELIGELQSLKRANTRLQKKLKEAEEKYKLFFEDSPLPAFITSLDGTKVVDANGKAIELAGYSSKDEFLKEFATGERDADPLAKGDLFRELQSKGEVTNKEYRFFKKDGKPIWVNFNARIYSPKGWLIVEAVDITRSKQLENNLRKAQRELKKRVKERTTELEQARDFLENIFNTSVDGIMATDQQGTITLVNDAMEKMSGYSKGELVGMHTGELITQDEVHRQEGEAIIGQLLEEGSASGSVRWLKKDGSPVDIEMNISLLPGEDGYFKGAVGVIRDVSERKQVEKALRKSEKKYRELVQNANTVILRMDLAGKITFFNEYAQRFFGFTEEEIIGKNVVGTIVPERESTGRDLAAMIRDVGIHPERYTINENENMRSNGEKVWIAWTNNVVFDEDNKVEELLCFGNDVTEHKRADEKLQETKEFLDNIIESSLDAIVIADTKGYIARANSAFLKLVGCENVEQVTGKHMMEFAPREKGVYESTTGYAIEVGDDFFEDTKEWMSRLVRDGKITTLETFHLNTDNILIPVEDTVSYIYNSEGVRMGTVGIIRDITERKQAQMVLQRQKHDLEERFKELTALFNISKLCQERGIGLEGLLQGIVESMPSAWQYPGITCARITYTGQEFSTEGFRETLWRQSTDIVISGEKAGSVEVCYLEERPECDKGPFLLEEENLIEAIKREIENAIIIRQVGEKLIEYQDQLRSMASQLTLIEERERRKFATYIHDQIGQSLFSAKIRLEALGDTVPHTDGKQSVHEISAILEQVIKDSRDLTFEVGAPILYQLGIEAALKGFVEKINKDSDVKATFRSDKKIKALDEDVSIFLFRAVQELLNNVVKHAQAHNVEISIYSKDAQTCVSVKDDGIGFKYSEADPSLVEDFRFGLFSIRERLVHFGGHLVVEAAFGQGTCITLVVP